MKESLNTEFKSSFNDSVIETLVAFVNTNGGKVLIGVNDKGIPLKEFKTGSETVQQWLNEIKNKTQPAIIPNVNALKLKGKEITVLSVQEFPVKPVSFKGRYYKRVKNSNHQLNAVEISDLSMQSLQLSWDAYPALKTKLTDLDAKKIKIFIQKVNTAGRFTLKGNATQCLRKLRLINNGSVTNAAKLLFGKKDTPYNVHIGRFKTPSHIIDDKMLNGTLFQVVEETMNYIVAHLKVAFEITGKTTQRTEIFEYPLPALRELVLNALIHRDYLSPVDVQIKIYDNSITFFNPGKLYGSLTVEDLKTNSYQAYARNKLIAEAFYLTGDIEKYGSGFIRIREELKKYPTMKLVCEEIPNGLLSTVSYTKQKTAFDANGKAGEGVNGELNGELNTKQKAVFDFINQKQGANAKLLAAELKIPFSTIDKIIRVLLSKGLIKRQGSKKTGGYWKK